MEQAENSLVAWINEELTRRDWSMRKLAQEAGLSHTHVSNVLSGNRKVTFDFCAAIAGPLAKPPEEIFRIAGLLPELPAEDATLRELIAFAKRLTSAERLEVLRYVEFRYQIQKKEEAARKKRKKPPAGAET